MPEPRDQELLDAIKRGDESAYRELMRLHSGKVFGIAMNMLRNEQDARDVVQDTFLNVYRRIDSFRGDAPLANWIYRIATNNALMKLRRRRRKPETSLEIRRPGFDSEGSHERDIVDWAPLADQLKETRELGERIREAVDELPESYRTVLVLADYRDMSMKEIAETLDITVPNVKTRLHRARLSVREALGEYLAGRV